MSIKSTIKKSLPKSYIYHREYKLHQQNANKTYAEIEREINANFQKKFGRPIDWGNPKSYNEKLNVAKVYGATKIKTHLTDKILAAKWVQKQVGDECNYIPLIATFDSVDEINFDKLPTRYVMKMNNDSGSVYIHDEEHPVTKEIITKYKYYFQKRNYAYNGYEMHYKDIKPTIMIEQYMGEAIRDYKFQCFDGEVAYCQVDFERFSNEHARNLYNSKWELLPFNKGNLPNTSTPVEKPTNFLKMWKLATKLSQGFDQVRVDFYDINNEVYFGEMTFTSASGLSRFTDDAIDYQMGAKWKLDMGQIRERRHKLLTTNAKLKDQ